MGLVEKVYEWSWNGEGLFKGEDRNGVWEIVICEVEIFVEWWKMGLVNGSMVYVVEEV